MFDDDEQPDPFNVVECWEWEARPRPGQWIESGMRSCCIETQLKSISRLMGLFRIDPTSEEWRLRLLRNFRKERISELSFDEAEDLEGKLSDRLERFGDASDKDAKRSRRMEDLGMELVDYERRYQK